MKVLVLGRGLLGGAFARQQEAAASFAARGGVKWDVDLTVLGRSQCDITDLAGVAAALDEHKPDAVVNAAAYTDVDGAEKHAGEAMLVNAIGAGNVAVAAARAGAALVHVSTDYVFGNGFVKPIEPGWPTEPLSLYGRSKLYGEGVVRSLHPGAIVVRTASSYSINTTARGAMMWLTKLAPEVKSVRVLDQMISPTAVEDTAHAILHLLRSGSVGVFHYAGKGVNRMELARFILGEMRCGDVDVLPMDPADLPARRPDYAVLESLRHDLILPPRPWRQGYGSVLAAMMRGT